MFCKHCYNNSGTHNEIPDVMTPDKWISFTKHIVELGGVIECHLSGGEPFLLGDSLFDIMDILHDDDTVFLLSTNGYFLTKETACRLGKYNYHWLQISIDSASAAYHDSFRQLRGSWENAIRSATFVVENNIPLKIVHCVTPYNLHEIDDMCSLAFSLGATSIIVGDVCLSGRASGHLDLLLSQREKQILRGKFEENYAKYKGRMLVKISHSVQSGLTKHLIDPRSKAVIRPNGDIKIDDMAPFIVGNIIMDEFSEIWENKINESWKNQKLLEYISAFDSDDRNYSIINYQKDDIKL